MSYLGGLLARSSIATYPIGLLILVTSAYGSLTVAGLVTGVFGAAAVVAGPVAGRGYDNYGPARVLPVAAVLQVFALLLVVVGAVFRVPVPLLLAGAAVLGLLVPQAGVLVRARWVATLTDPASLQRKLYLEGALDEATFVLGPLLIAGLGRLSGPAVAVLVAGLVAAAGGLVLSRLSWPSRPASSLSLRAPLGLWRLALAFACVGGVFACVQVGLLTAAPSLAGLLLAGFSLVSLVSSLVASSIGFSYRAAVAMLAVGLLGAGLTVGRSAAWLLPLAVAACAAAPAVASGYGQAERFTRDGGIVASLGLVTAGLNLGLAGGTALAGAIGDAGGARAVLLLGFGLGAAAWLAASPSRTRLRPPRRRRRRLATRSRLR
jgi:hypothetical protein